MTHSWCLGYWPINLDIRRDYLSSTAKRATLYGNMTPFEAKIQMTSTEHILTIIGGLDENSELPKFQDKKNIRVNLGKLSHISSHGVKIWVDWLTAHSQYSVSLEQCPFIFIRNCSSLKDFLTPNVSVTSFYVPFYNEASEETKNILFQREVDFKADGTLVIPQINDSHGNAMEMDVIQSKYFSFLKPQKD